MQKSIFSFFQEELKASHIPWWEWDLLTNKVVTSPLKVTMLGYGPDEFVGCGY
ncbi:hypothetical protein [Chitinivibrio alkaliphilus]|uniref:Uncharacterized protein n=1 Tax=Chitinivibrio alkaliphilus ACht1 TaxID=1313304 RepID=U7DA53_9BACT|nr:hypothetical protein [Chitinivibrio alkaliphilus]ERP31320.1 hypothetical protein CALK_1809 [Chitinivibrio alkaliphilus ACht1]